MLPLLLLPSDQRGLGGERQGDGAEGRENDAEGSLSHHHGDEEITRIQAAFYY